MTTKTACIYILYFVHFFTFTSFYGFHLGLENIPDDFVQKIKGARIGLITNQTGKDQQGKRNIDILRKKGLNIKIIFTPEHGLSGTVQAGHHISNVIDKETSIPIISLYKDQGGCTLNQKEVDNLDIIIFDIQDSGIRHYTYISTLFQTLDIAGQFKKDYIVLDRPNPLGYIMEGPLVDVTLQSFISIAPIPLRHAMTPGELAWFFNTHLIEKPAKLHIVPMKGYTRTMDLSKGTFNALSPNITTLQSCYCYSFLGLLGEVKPFDVGIGTEKAFQLILLPEEIKLPKTCWTKIQEILKKNGISSIPYQRYIDAKKKLFKGLQIKIDDINNVDSFTALLEILESFKKDSLHISFSSSFDKAAGTKKVRTYLRGVTSYRNLANRINTNLNEFLQKAQSSLMYEPKPKLALLANRPYI